MSGASPADGHSLLEKVPRPSRGSHPQRKLRRGVLYHARTENGTNCNPWGGPPPEPPRQGSTLNLSPLETFAQPPTVGAGRVLPLLPTETFAKLRRREERRPLASGRGACAGSYALSRWERVGVRAGGGGGRATLLKPARPVTQRSPTGED